jgi:hypothetical protein
MSFNFVVDRIVNGRAYPSLARHQAEPYTLDWQQFIQHWPYTVPCELIEHCDTFEFPYQLYTVDQDYPSGSFYLVGIGFFDFDIDYFELMDNQIITALKSGKLRVLFYYHEGDNPHYILGHLDRLCRQHELPTNCYHFVSGNIAANSHSPKFVYFPCHELLYWRRNQASPALLVHSNPRERDFTVLSRVHKWWRATVMTDLYRNGLLDNSYWSYSTNIEAEEIKTANPIETYTMNINYAMEQFLEGAPYTCDQLTQDDHNNHAMVVAEHYTNSYCNIVLETLYGDDPGECMGAFLTEKTFKAIKNGQPFIIVGRSGILNLLQQLGYRTFNHAIDPSYDIYNDNTERWRRILEQIVQVKKADKTKWFELCREDAKHNQRLFLSSKRDRLNTLFTQLTQL